MDEYNRKLKAFFSFTHSAAAYAVENFSFL